MRIEALTYFLEVSRMESFSSAARKLFVSQQGLSKTIRNLEKDLGVELFERDGKKVRLTDAGKTLLPLAEDHLETYEAIKQSMGALSNTANPKQAITLYAMPYTVSLLRSLESAAAFSKLQEGVVLLEESLREIIVNIATGRSSIAKAGIIDIPAATIPDLVENHGVGITPLIRSDLTLKGTRDLISPRRTSISKAEASALPIAFFKEEVLEGLVQTMFASHPLQNIVMKTSNLAIREDLTRQGAAVTFSDTFNAFIASGIDDFLYVPLEDSPSFVVAFVYAKGVPLPEEYVRYMGCVKGYLETSFSRYFKQYPLDDE